MPFWVQMGICFYWGSPNPRILGARGFFIKTICICTSMCPKWSRKSTEPSVVSGEKILCLFFLFCARAVRNFYGVKKPIWSAKMAQNYLKKVVGNGCLTKYLVFFIHFRINFGTGFSEREKLLTWFARNISSIFFLETLEIVPDHFQYIEARILHVNSKPDNFLSFWGYFRAFLRFIGCA